MDPKVQSGSTAEELVENFASSATRFPACVALQELGIGALGAVHSGLGHCGRPNRSLCRGLGWVVSLKLCKKG